VADSAGHHRPGLTRHSRNLYNFTMKSMKHMK
jgi:hypothetical protein